MSGFQERSRILHPWMLGTTACSWQSPELEEWGPYDPSETASTCSSPDVSHQEMSLSLHRIGHTCDTSHAPGASFPTVTNALWESHRTSWSLGLAANLRTQWRLLHRHAIRTSAHPTFCSIGHSTTLRDQLKFMCLITSTRLLGILETSQQRIQGSLFPTRHSTAFWALVATEHTTSLPQSELLRYNDPSFIPHTAKTHAKPYLHQPYLHHSPFKGVSWLGCFLETLRSFSKAWYSSTVSSGLIWYLALRKQDFRRSAGSPASLVRASANILSVGTHLI